MNPSHTHAPADVENRVDEHEPEMYREPTPVHVGERPVGRFLMQVLWPAFLIAIVAEGIVFSLIDPRELTVVGVYLADSREAAYTVGFVFFWLLCALASGLTYLLSRGDRVSPAPPSGQR